MYVGSASWGQLTAGDAVRYRQLTGASSDGVGLTSDQTYFVIKGVDGYTIQLAASFCQAVGPSGAGCADDDEITPIVLTVPPLTDGTRHRFERSLGGLVDGRTYYVVNADAAAGTIQLADGPNGLPITFAVVHRAGPHQLGIVEVDLVSGGGPDRQALFVDLVTTCSGPCGRLLAPSGQPLSSVTPSIGDGISTASAQGGTGGFADFAFPSAGVNGSPSVSITIGAAQLTAGVDVVVDGQSYFSASAAGDSAGGGFVSVGTAVSSVDLGDSPTTVTLAAGSAITAGRDVTVTAGTDHTLSSSARSVGGGFAGVKTAYTHASMDDDVIVTVGGTVLAGRAVAIRADAATTASTSSGTIAGGAGAGADSDDGNGGSRGVRLGSAADPTERKVVIAGGASITGRTVDLAATVSRLNATASASAEAYAFAYAQAYAVAYVDAFSTASVTVNDGGSGTRSPGSRA